ncbi:MAG: hypothetical protein E7044_01300 [Lentisphaerae bacterium]|nr:hypothetical protein [Lentisphaerota bacterium]
MKYLFQKWLFLLVVLAFLITFAVSWHLHSYLAELSAVDMLESTLTGVCRKISVTEHNLKAVTHISDAAALAKTHAFALLVASDPSILNNDGKLDTLRKKLDVDELHVSDDKGILIASRANEAASGVKSYRNYNMASTAQSAAFMPAITDPSFELVQDPQINGAKGIYFQYAGVARIDKPGIVQIGYRPERIIEAQHLADIKQIEKETRIGTNGSLRITESTGLPAGYKKVFRTSSSLLLCIVYDKYLLTAELPQEEMYVSRDSILKVLIIGNLILFGVIFLLVSRLLQKVVINGIYSVNDSLNEITGGNLEKKVTVSTTTEFCTLSNGINATVSALKKAIEDEAKRLDDELETGRMIQTSVLPVDFKDNERYVLHAGMFTAREVGGDFYDFFALDEDNLAILIADVSGKGITAALYMMTAKTLLKELIQKYPPAEAFDLANQELCKNNKAHMFLTAFAGVINLKTGIMTCVNAGHNPPVLKHADGTAEYLRIKHSLVLSASRKARYTAVDLQLKKNDQIILYTDGVTEAMNCSKQLFGEERFLKTLSGSIVTPMETVHLIRAEVSEFAGSTPQNDDITLLVMEYK